MSRSNRRSFLKRSAALASAFAVPAFVPGSVLGKDGQVAPSERVTLGSIGVGSMGRERLLSGTGSRIPNAAAGTT